METAVSRLHLLVEAHTAGGERVIQPELTFTESKRAAEELFELGKLRFELGDFPSSIINLEAAARHYAHAREHRRFTKCLILCLRMYAEMEDPAALDHVKERLYDHLTRERLDLNSTTYYTLAQIEIYRGKFAKALELLDRALSLALADDNKEDICFAMHGLAAVYWSLGRTEDSLKELHNLRVFFQVLRLPDLEVSARILHGYILVSRKEHEEALELFWAAFESLKHQKNLYAYVSLLFAMGFAYAEAGEVEPARTYMRLAQRMADPGSFVYLHRKIDEFNARLAAEEQNTFDLIFAAASNSVTERNKGRIDFKNQFILLDMLKLFLRSPGEVHTKESLVRTVWRQNYDPSVHDNKIYVTIKRLRQLIEPDFDKPKYIFRAKNGYYLNRDAKVVIEP